MTARVAAIVVTYQHGEEIVPCVEALRAERSGALDLDVVVVDNASSDGTRERVRALGDVRLVELRRNTGFAHAVNAGVRATTADVVALVNPDCVVDPGCLGRLREHLLARPHVGVAAALLRNPDGSPQLFARRELTLAGVFWSYTELGLRVDRRLLRGRHHARRRCAERWSPEPAAPFAVDEAAAACIVLRRMDAIPAALDERLPLYFNDADLYRRLRRRGLRCEIVPAATAVHGYGTSVARLPTDRARAELLASLRRYAAEWPLAARVAADLLLLLDAAAGAALLAAGRGTHDTRARVRGALGALGLPGGARPWLAAPRGGAKGGAA